MVTFTKKGSMATCIATIDGVDRFIVNERTDFTGGWDLLTLDGSKIIGRFETLLELETYILEMDK